MSNYYNTANSSYLLQSESEPKDSTTLKIESNEDIGLEVGAYESLWLEPKATFKSLSRRLMPAIPFPISSLVAKSLSLQALETIRTNLATAGIQDTQVVINGMNTYPIDLLDAEYPIKLFYFRGDLDLLTTKRIAIVGTRLPSPIGIKNAKLISMAFAKEGFSIVSGLARGIDTIAHRTALEEGGKTIAVIGTPLSHSYPPENSPLQQIIASEHLLISQIPFLRYERQNPRSNRFFFPERNITMAALSQATVIVEAGETSGSLIQARAALAQGRKLFILDNCFRNESLRWPKRLLEKGAIRVGNYKEIRDELVS